MAADGEPTSLEARISKPEDTVSKTIAEKSDKPESKTLDNAETKEAVAADGDAAKPTGEPIIPDGKDAQPVDNTKDGELPKAQTDGAASLYGGTGGIYEPDYDVEIRLSNAQADPNNPLFSIKSFNELGLHDNVIKGIYQMRFTKPSKIQERALPLLLSNPPMNLIGQSQSGTGKTAAFVLNILTRLDCSTPEMCQTPQALCLAPTRELARQILGVVQIMGQFVENLTTAAAIPTDQENRGKRIEAQVIVGTPGTTTDLIRKKLINPAHIKVLVLDEADNMLEQQGLGDQSLRVKQILPKNIQVVLFSATFPDRVVTYAAKFAPNANQITLKHEELTVDGIKQLYLDCKSTEDKYDSLVRLYGLMTIGSSIIFVKTRETALQIETRMNAEGHKVACLTGQFEGFQRDIIIDSFRNGTTKVLITTNVLARGIDVQTVSLVINYDVPMYQNNHGDPQTYLHRIGRTGRFGRVGVSICMLCGSRDWAALKEISDYFGVDMIGLDTRDWDQIEKSVKRIIKSTRADPDYNKGPEMRM